MKVWIYYALGMLQHKPTGKLSKHAVNTKGNRKMFPDCRTWAMCRTKIRKTATVRGSQNVRYGIGNAIYEKEETIPHLRKNNIEISEHVPVMIEKIKMLAMNLSRIHPSKRPEIVNTYITNTKNITLPKNNIGSKVHKRRHSRMNVKKMQ